ncbi:MAG TPA: SGNH/GDSL hydrolase family protein [Burkholderiales bacterium]|jgi:outer membrane lipase/esterase|nr:SGNH/GDSL hydrolase family protein [Burkholderiales bacterium]
MRKALLQIFIFALALFAAPWASAQLAFNRLVVFGDSLSDPGNAFVLLGATNTPPDWSVDAFLVPDRPYARGGQHFSNGATWIEQMARPLGLANSVRPAFRSASGATNFAIGGARARADGSGTDLTSQVQAFLNAAGNAAPADALYVVEIGGNDLRDALLAFVQTLQSGGTPVQAQAAAGAIITDAVAATGAQMQALAGAGARRFLVWRVPNIGATPAIRGLGALDPAIPGVADSLTQAFNAALETNVLAPLAASGLGIVRLDVYAKLNQIIANGAAFGLSNVTAACITPSVPPFQCQTPDQYLFWDGIHPTAAGHAIIAQYATYVLTH